MKEFIKRILLKVPIMIKEFFLNDIIADNKKINEKIDRLELNLHQNSLDTMKVAICSEEIPLKERVDIGKKYIEAGGNGSIKIKVHVLEELLEEEEIKKERDNLK